MNQRRELKWIQASPSINIFESVWGKKWDAETQKTNHSDKIWNMLPIWFNSIHSIHNSNLIHNQWHKGIHFIVFMMFFFLEFTGFLFFLLLIKRTRSDALAHNLLVLVPYEHVYILQSKDDKNDWWHLVIYRRSLSSVFCRYWQIDAMQICIFHKRLMKGPFWLLKIDFHSIFIVRCSDWRNKNIKIKPSIKWHPKHQLLKLNWYQFERMN